MRYDKYICWNPNLCVLYTHLQDLFQIVEISCPSKVIISGHIDLKNRGDTGHFQDWVGWGVRGSIRGPGTTSSEVIATTGVGVGLPSGFSGTNKWIKGCVTTGNVSREQHYVTAVIDGYIELQDSGFYRIEFWGKCHESSNDTPISSSTYGYPAISGIEVNGDGGSSDPYNHVSVVVEAL